MASLFICLLSGMVLILKVCNKCPDQTAYMIKAIWPSYPVYLRRAIVWPCASCRFDLARHVKTDIFYHSVVNITKTCLYNSEHLKPHFYIVKLGFTGVYIIFFLFFAQNVDCGYSLESLRRIFWNIKSIRVFFIWKVSVFRWFFLYMNRRVLVMIRYIPIWEEQ